jgi:hypothetical protein
MNIGAEACPWAAEKPEQAGYMAWQQLWSARRQECAAVQVAASRRAAQLLPAQPLRLLQLTTRAAAANQTRGCRYKPAEIGKDREEACPGAAATPPRPRIRSPVVKQATRTPAAARAAPAGWPHRPRMVKQLAVSPEAEAPPYPWTARTEH